MILCYIILYDEALEEGEAREHGPENPRREHRLRVPPDLGRGYS